MEPKPTYAWVGVVGDLVLVVVGVWLISRGWTDVGEIVVLVSVVGLVASLVQLWRARRPADH